MGCGVLPTEGSAPAYWPVSPTERLILRSTGERLTSLTSCSGTLGAFARLQAERSQATTYLRLLVLMLCWILMLALRPEGAAAGAGTGVAPAGSAA